MKIDKITFFNKYHWVIFSLVAMILIYPSFAPGYIFAIDWKITPFITWHDIAWTDPIGWIICDIGAVLLGFGTFQRILLFGMIVLMGMAGFRLVKRLNNVYAGYFSGLLLIFNPFFYARMVEQTMIVGMGIVAFMWFVVLLKEYFEEKRVMQMIGSAISAGLAISFFAHSIFFVAVTFFVVSIYMGIHSKEWKKIITLSLIFWAIVFFLNGNWIIASLHSDGTWASKITTFTYDDLETFRTRKIGGLSIYSTVISLQGYWGEYQDRFVSIQDNFLWSSGFLGIVLCALIGFRRKWNNDPFGKALIVIWCIAYVLALGVASPITKSLVMIMYEHVPYYMGLRESHKWVVVMLLAYAYMGAWGIKILFKSTLCKNWRMEIGLLCVLLPVVFSFSMIRGMHEHVVPYVFPHEWNDMRNYIMIQHQDDKTLFLPWHAYIPVSFADKVIINPAKSYFGQHLITGNNVEFGKVENNFTDPLSQMIEYHIDQKDDPMIFMKDLCAVDINTAVIARVDDWKDYQWLETAWIEYKTHENGGFVFYDFTPACQSGQE